MAEHDHSQAVCGNDRCRNDPDVAVRNTGVIQFVYGDGIVVNSANGGYTIGLQSGAATNLASVTNATSTVSYTTANNTQTDAVTSGTSYSFTPNVPTQPTNMTFNSVTPTSLNVGWTDNATNELGFLISRSVDGINFTSVGSAAANATSFSDSGLLPSTNYTYRVQAFSEGALSRRTGRKPDNVRSWKYCIGRGGRPLELTGDLGRRRGAHSGRQRHHH